MLTTSFAMMLSQTMAAAKVMGTNSICTHQCGGLLGLNTHNRNKDNTVAVRREIRSVNMCIQIDLHLTKLMCMPYGMHSGASNYTVL